MSSTKTDNVLALDNRINVASEATGVVQISGVNTNYFLIPADGSTFPSQIQFNNIVTPSLTSTLVSRNIRLLYRLQVSYPSTGANAPTPALCLPKPYYDPSYQVNTYLRQFPLQSCCDSLSLVINGSTTTLNPRQVISGLARRIDKQYLAHQGSEFPSMPDNRAILIPDSVNFTGSWSAAAYPGVGTAVNVAFSNGMTGSFTTGAAYPAVGTFVPVAITQFPAVRAYWVAGTAFVANQAVPVYVDQGSVSCQPTSKYEASCDNASRASFKPLTFAQNVASPGTANGVDRWTFEISEPLLISPLTLHDKEVFLANINTLTVQANYSLLYDMVVSSGLVPATAINRANLTCEIISPTPQLQLTYIQVDPAIVSIPQAVSYPYESVVYYPKTSQYTMALSSDQILTQQIVSDTIRFQTMPSLILVYARQSMASRLNPSGAQANCAGRCADCFLSLGDPNSGNAQTSIQIGTRTGLLASASRKQIYRMARDNGYTSSWEDWDYGSGSLMLIDVVKDLGINIEAGDVVPGEASGNVNFQISMTVNNSNFNYVAQTQAQRESLGVPAGDCPIELMIVAIYSGVATIDPTGTLYSLGELSPAEVSTLVSTAPKDGTMISSEAINPTIKGGSLFSSVKSILGKTARGVQAVTSNPLFQQAVGMASKLHGGRMRRYI
jgi:hypothetical protein